MQIENSIPVLVYQPGQSKKMKMEDLKSKRKRKNWYIQSAKDQKKSDKANESKSKVYT